MDLRRMVTDEKNNKSWHCELNGCSNLVYGVAGGGKPSLLCPDCKTRYDGNISRTVQDMLCELKRNRCNNRHDDVTIDVNDIYNIWPITDTCPLLKVPFKKKTRYAATLDRIDSSLGYHPDNIQIISYKANSMKNDATDYELIVFAESILEIYNGH